jgi:rubrerythrin
MSTLIFNANEIFEIAKQIERNGAAFYRAAAPMMPDDDGKKLLLELAQMEVAHEHVFDVLQKKLSGDELGETMYDPHDDAYVFLKRMADTFVFSPNEKGDAVLKEGVTVSAILTFAIQREKDSIIFYEGVKAMVPQKFGGPRLDEIIAQEMGHILILSKELDKHQNA